MTLLTIGASVILLAAQASSPGSLCADATLTSAERELCFGDEATKHALSLPPKDADRRPIFELAARHYRRASDDSTGELKEKALAALATAYESGRLDSPVEHEVVLRELIALVPGEPRYAFDLAALQEKEGFLDAAEDTLLGARQRHPQQPEVFRRLAQFYARRISALQDSPSSDSSSDPVAAGERDTDGVYRIGGSLKPPPRAGTPRYPMDAQSAGIEGGVEAEIVINEQGEVRDARIVRSVPLLDEAALNAVRQWRFEPTVVDGQSVPVRMVVTVRFTLSK